MKKAKLNEQRTKSTVKKSKYTLFIISFILIGVIFFFIKIYNNPSLNINQNFIFQTSKGKVFKLEASKNHLKVNELKGKIVFIKVFGWNCQYCQKEIPELIKLKNKFKTAFETIAIESQHHSQKENLEFIKNKQINYHIVAGDKQEKFLEYLKQTYDWNGVIPLTIVMDTNGKILAFEVGYKSYSLTKLLHTTLKMLTTEAIESPKSKGE